MSSRPIMRRSIISSASRCRGSGAAPPASRRTSSGVGGVPPGGAMPMRSSIICGHVVGDRVLERDVARREPHVLVAGLVFPTGFVARVRLEQAGAGARARCRRSTRRSSAAGRRPSARGSSPPKPSTVPMRVSDVIDRLAHAFARAGTSTARRSGTPRATARAARRGSRCRTARGATAATRRSRERGCACAGDT